MVGDGVAQGVVAGVAGVAGQEGGGHLFILLAFIISGFSWSGNRGAILAYIFMVDGNKRPINQAHKLLHLGLHPRLEDGVLGRHAVDRDGGHICITQIGLMEHVGVMVQTEQVTHDLALLRSEQVVKVTGASGRVDPLLQRAVRGIAVVVDAGGETRVDLHTGETVGVFVGPVGPHVVLLVQEGRARVITHAVGDSVFPPGAQGVAVVQARDGGRDDAVGSEVLGGGDANLFQPGLVEGDFLVDIRVGGIVLLLVGEGVGDVTELVLVGGVGPPEQERVELCAGGAPVVGSGRGGPEVGAGSQRLLPFQGSVGGRVVLDAALVAGGVALVRDPGGGFNVAVAVVADFDVVVAAGVHLAVNFRQPVSNAVQVGRGDAESGAIGLVDVGFQEHVVDLRVQVHAAVTRVQTAGEPGNPCVLQVRGGGAPGSIEGDEEGHLLTAIEVVDHGSGGLAARVGVGGKTSDFFGGGGVGDSGRIVPEASGAHARTGLQARRGKVADVRERHQLFDPGGTAAVAGSAGAVTRARIHVVLHHAHPVGQLVGVQLVPLVRG